MENPTSEFLAVETMNEQITPTTIYIKNTNEKNTSF